VSDARKRPAPRKAAAKENAGAERARAKRPVSKAAAPAKTKAVRKKKTVAKKAAKAPRKARRKTGTNGVAALAAAVLDDMKAQDVRTLDVRHLTSVTDTMIVAAGRSDRHVRAIADALLERCKAAGYPPLGVEGQDSGEWVLVDLGDVIVHVMLPRIREFYNIEGLWDISARAAAES